MTLKKIAEMANVSVSTASRALNNSYGISEATRKQVVSAAEACGYFAEKKRVKIENRRKDCPSFAIICPEIISSYYSRMAVFLIDFLRENGCDSTLYNTAFSEENHRKLFKKCLDDPDTDAIISFGTLDLKMGKESIPIAFFGKSRDNSSVVHEMTFGIERAVGHLVSKGRKHIAFVGEQLTLSKQEVFLKICEDFPLVKTDCFCTVQRFEQAGTAAAWYFLNRSEMPDGIICAYDEIAYGLISSLKENGVRVPQDVSVIGINDIPSAPYFFGGLSTVKFEHEEVIKKLVRDMIDDHKSGTVQKREYSVKSTLVLRNTD